MSAAIRVLVVDDSAFARKVVREVLSSAAGIEVVGIARDGLEALEKIAELKPDVITLDLVMPNLDGLGVLRELPQRDAPRVILVSISDASSELAVRALQLGALDLVRKPTALATDQLYELGAELVTKVRAAAVARVPERSTSAATACAHAPAPSKTQLVVIGTSTGGPQALSRLLPALPGDFPVPIAIALHIPAGYTEALAARIDEQSPLHVVEAQQDLVLQAGTAVLARGGSHLGFQRTGDALRADLRTVRPELLHVPSVDLLFESAVHVCGGNVLGVVLTGMGDDGLRGARAIRAAGGTVLTESAQSAVIYGMPRAVSEAGLSNEESPLAELAGRICAYL